MLKLFFYPSDSPRIPYRTAMIHREAYTPNQGCELRGSCRKSLKATTEDHSISKLETVLRATESSGKKTAPRRDFGTNPLTPDADDESIFTPNTSEQKPGEQVLAIPTSFIESCKAWYASLCSPLGTKDVGHRIVELLNADRTLRIDMAAQLRERRTSKNRAHGKRTCWSQ